MKPGREAQSGPAAGAVPAPRRVYYGWYVIAVAFVAAGLAVGSSQYAFGVFVTPLENDFGWSRTQVNGALSLAAISGLIAPLLGRLIDRYGCRPVMAFSLLLTAVGFGLRPFMTELWQWYALNAVQFVGMPGATVLPAGKLVGLWFQRTRGRMMGITTMGNNFGGLTMPLMAGYIVGASGWQWGYVAFAVLAVLITPAVLLVVRDKPADVQRELDRRAGAVTDANAKTPGARRALAGLSVSQALKTPTFYFLCLGLTLSSFTYPAILTQLIPHMENEGMSLQRASLVVSVMAAFGMAGKLTFGYMAERITGRYALMLSLTLQIACLGFLLSIRGNSPLMFLFVTMFGLPFGGVGALQPLIVQETFGVRYFGSILGLVNAAMVGSSIIGPLMAGAFYDATLSYRGNFIAVMGIFAAGVLALWLARPPRGTQEQTVPAELGKG